ncbi:MAG: Wzz/FepE/Etk N-terminal domain-containing protein, partial [Paracoccaceae bacterium]|nr:Wzz/FepE/Etk N-terminal domain-containing protein [Paracoccaceae bacterium]
MNPDIRFYLAVFVRRLHYFLAVFVLGTAISLSVALLLPPVYEAEATLLVESAQIPQELAAPTVT